MPEVRVILLCAPLLFSGKFQVVAASPFPLEHYPRFLDSCPSLFPWYTGLLLLQLVEESICFSTWHSFRPHWCGHPCFRPQLSLLGRQIREEQSVGNWKAKVALQVRPWWQRYTKDRYEILLCHSKCLNHLMELINRRDWCLCWQRKRGGKQCSTTRRPAGSSKSKRR